MPSEIEKLSKQISSVSTTIEHQSKKTESVAKNIDTLGASIQRAIPLLSVDLLTDEEINELKMLINKQHQAREFAEQRMQTENIKGMYLQLSDSGFINCVRTSSEDVVFVSVTPKASWAIRRKELSHQNEEQDKKQRMKDQLFSNALGIITGCTVSIFTMVIIQLVSLLL